MASTCGGGWRFDGGGGARLGVGILGSDEEKIIRVTPSESSRLQKLLFKNGYKWKMGETSVILTDYKYLCVKVASRSIKCQSSLDYYGEKRLISLEDFINKYLKGETSMNILKRLTKTVKKYLDASLHSLYQLEWIEFDEDDLVLTSDGKSNLLNFLALEHPEISKSFGEWAQKEVDEVKKEEKRKK